ncbi:MAG: hypothetical protein HYT70_04395 [Candidatus Aenigmarchaeota archaeon]|nr:hypothetical protein [Candidatus Aenigmarchaeota archaeon]
MGFKEFFKITLNKIVIAKVFGIPLLIADFAFNIFSYFETSVIAKVSILVVASYTAACLIDYFIKLKNNSDKVRIGNWEKGGEKHA